MIDELSDLTECCFESVFRGRCCLQGCNNLLHVLRKWLLWQLHALASYTLCPFQIFDVPHEHLKVQNGNSNGGQVHVGHHERDARATRWPDASGCVATHACHAAAYWAAALLALLRTTDSHMRKQGIAIAAGLENWPWQLKFCQYQLLSAASLICSKGPVTWVTTTKLQTLLSQGRMRCKLEATGGTVGRARVN